jgi:hypothetical protein
MALGSISQVVKTTLINMARHSLHAHCLSPGQCR